MAAMDTVDRSLLLRGLDEAARETVLAESRRREYAKDTTMFNQGDAASEFYLVESGRVKLVQLTPEGREMIVRFINPGEVIAAVALVPGGRFPVSAVTAEPTAVRYWTSAVIRSLAGRIADLQPNIMAAMAMHMQGALDQGRDLATSKVPARIAAMLLRLAEHGGKRTEDGLLIDQKLTREELADMTGTTLFSVSRVLSEWQSQGLVETSRRRILIRDPAALERLSGR